MNNNSHIVDIALEELTKTTSIKASFDKLSDASAGKLNLVLGKNSEAFFVAIKKRINETTLHDLRQQRSMYRDHFIVIAEYIQPRIKELLRESEIPYMDAAGNIWLNHPKFLLFIDGKKQKKSHAGNGGKTFTKAGVKLIFNFFLDEDRINMTYRDLAALNDMSLGNVTNLMKGLEQNRFIIKRNSKEYLLNNKRQLLNEWIQAYKERLKPTMFRGNFRFLTTTAMSKWKELQLNRGKTYWGGEPAGDLLTNYLQPQEWTLYTTETRNEMITYYRLVPDDAGNVKAYHQFYAPPSEEGITVPPVLACADLILQGDPRNQEIGQKIYDKYLQNQFGPASH